MTVSSVDKSTTLQPSYSIPIVLIAGGILGVGVSLVTAWLPLVIVASVLVLFGLFLLYQATTLRLVFTDQNLDIYRGENRIRQFPYQDWEVWDIFWSPAPILFYFREVNSIHFLPILFSPAMLRSQLEQHLPEQASDR